MKRLLVVLMVVFPILGMAQNDNQTEDFANFARYEEENKALIDQDVQPNTVFMGNSITELWYDLDPDFFEDNDIVGRGISGQVTSQMLLRFREDVIRLHPDRVVILGGTNDIARNQGEIALDRVLGNIIAMTELAQAHDIDVVLSSVLPALQFEWRKSLSPAKKIKILNSKIKAYADDHDIPFVDYYPALKNSKGRMQDDYSEDGVHPNKKGYEIMEDIVMKVLD